MWNMLSEKVQNLALILQLTLTFFITFTWIFKMNEWVFVSMLAPELDANILHNQKSRFIISRFYYIRNSSLINITILSPCLLEYRRRFVAICLLFFFFLPVCGSVLEEKMEDSCQWCDICLCHPVLPLHSSTPSSSSFLSSQLTEEQWRWLAHIPSKTDNTTVEAT